MSIQELKFGRRLVHLWEPLTFTFLLHKIWNLTFGSRPSVRLPDVSLPVVVLVSLSSLLHFLLYLLFYTWSNFRILKFLREDNLFTSPSPFPDTTVCSKTEPLDLSIFFIEKRNIFYYLIDYSY